jgi:hypothetical protein
MDNSFKIGSHVIVYERNYPDIKYEGKIYQILEKGVNKKTDECDSNTQLAESFFISFSVEIYDKLLSQRYPIYYNNTQKIVSNLVRNEKTNKIEQIFVQYPFIDYEEEEIQLDKINAILISTTKWNLSIFQ